MKAWLVTEKDFYEVSCYVKADTRGKAISAAIRSDESDSFRETEWRNFRVKRIPEYDERLSWEQLVNDGRAWVECDGCQMRISGGEGEDLDPPTPMHVVEGVIWCSLACWEKHGSRVPRKPEVDRSAICLFAD